MAEPAVSGLGEPAPAANKQKLTGEALKVTATEISQACRSNAWKNFEVKMGRITTEPTAVKRVRLNEFTQTVGLTNKDRELKAKPKANPPDPGLCC